MIVQPYYTEFIVKTVNKNLQLRSSFEFYERQFSLLQGILEGTLNPQIQSMLLRIDYLNKSIDICFSDLQEILEGTFR